MLLNLRFGNPCVKMERIKAETATPEKTAFSRPLQLWCDVLKQSSLIQVAFGVGFWVLDRMLEFAVGKWRSLRGLLAVSK